MTGRFPTRRENLEWDAVQQAGPEAVRRFDEMLTNGTSVSMASMLATQSPPRTGVTDQTVSRNSKSVTEQFKGCPGMLEQYRTNYRRCTGESLPEDAVVYRGLAKFPGDPAAIVTHKHGLSAVKAAMKQRNEQVEGDWENHPVQQAPDPQTCRMNDIVMDRYKGEYRREEEFKDLPERELEEVILDTHAPVVSPEQAMAAHTSIDSLTKDVFGG